MRFPEKLFSVFLTLILLFNLACQKSQTNSPQIILWAWERPENLEFIDSGKVTVAFLAQTIELSSNAVKLIPRRQPLKVSSETKLIAVTRIETDKKADLSVEQKNEILRLVLKTLELKNVSAIQIDFDVTVSEREFYRQLLVDLRNQLPTNVGLTMTALASWCASDNWLKGFPVDEAIPMLFDMGADNKTIRDFLASGEDFNEPLCQKSYGISITEPLKIKFKPNRKFYLFTSSPLGWKKSDLESLPDGVSL